MKKLLLSIVAGAGLLFASQNTNAQALEQGNSAVDAYYGFVSLGKALWMEMGGDGASAKYFGAIGARYEYMVSDKMGVGAEFNYTDMELVWEDDYVDSTTVPPTTTKYSYRFDRTVIRFMPRFNIHFGGSEDFDGYFGVAVGYRSAKTSYSDNDGDSSNDETIEGLSPLAMRLAIGGRYYFTDNIGIHMEFGIGGGNMLHGGLSFKF